MFECDVKPKGAVLKLDRPDFLGDKINVTTEFCSCLFANSDSVSLFCGHLHRIDSVYGLVRLIPCL